MNKTNNLKLLYMMRTKKSKKTRKNNKTRKNKFIKDKCSPKKNKKEKISCYTKGSLNRLKNIWNMKHPDMKITSKDYVEIWKQLKSKMNNTCYRESCWLSELYEDEHLKEKEYLINFAAKTPKSWKKNPTEWLSSLEIIEVMKRWENIDDEFEFIGPSPIDYDTHIMYNECVWEELCEFNLEDTLNRGKKKIGIIFNLDKHNQPGSHWVALYIDLKKNEVYYFDSYGDRIPAQINKFVKKVQEQGKKLNINIKKITLKKRHQYSDSECGMYSLYFIIQLVKGKSISHFNKRISDKYMKKLRKTYFNDI